MHTYILLQQETERGSTREIINNIEPEILEIASEHHYGSRKEI